MPTCPPHPRSLTAACLLLALLPAGVNAAEPAASPAVAAPPPAQVDFTEIVARTSAAVVAIETRQIAGPGLPRGLPEDLAERLLELEVEMPLREVSGKGSGFFVSPDGHVVTNNHVVQDATRIEVVLDDGSTHAAELIGADPVTDLAVLRIDAGDHATVGWGDSEALSPGAWMIAVGSPFGLGGTVTVGVLSARQRDVEIGPFSDFLQTDAAINVGNSGGPLFNAAGEVVGVNTAIFSPTGGSVGIGFAVPSNTARRVVAELIEAGEVRRGFLGLGLQDLTAPLARAFGLASAEGALVGSVEQGGPAEAAGLRPGDVVLRLGEADIRSARDLSRAIETAEPGRSLPVRLLRNGEPRDLRVTVGRHRVEQARPVAAPAAAPREARLGLALRPLPEPVRRQLGLEAGGVIVQAVRPGGLGASHGLRRGDLILEAGRLPVGKPGDVAAAWSDARAANRPLLLQVRRGEEGLFVAIEG